MIYAKNPLEMVICQVRYPTILRIGASKPVGFQDRIRTRFPGFREVRPTMELDLPKDVAAFMDQVLGSGARAISYEFTSADEIWRAGLAESSLALTCRQYERWESFRESFRYVFDALEDEYKPSFYVRVGLRYRNVIRRSTLGLIDLPWRDLLQPQVLGEFSDPQISDHIDSAARDVTIRLADSSGVAHIRHGLAKSKETNEICWVIDSDFYLEAQLDGAQTFDALDRFHERSGRLFRWCITDGLHRSMEPSHVE